MELSLKRDEQPDDLTGMDDEWFVAAARVNRSAFTPLYHRYTVRVYRYIYSRVGNAADAEDLTAQVFADALAALPRYCARGRFAGWLFTFAYRRCADHHRLPVFEPLSEQHAAEAIPDPGDEVVRRETFSRLEQVLVTLNDEERELLRLHYAAGLNYREMGEVLGRREGAIKMAMSRLLQKMKLRWEVQDESD